MFPQMGVRQGKITKNGYKLISNHMMDDSNVIHTATTKKQKLLIKCKILNGKLVRT